MRFEAGFSPRLQNHASGLPKAILEPLRNGYVTLTFRQQPQALEPVCSGGHLKKGMFHAHDDTNTAE
jgi:hypothetical protein